MTDQEGGTVSNEERFEAPEWPGKDYVWQHYEGVDLVELYPAGLDAPEGYRLHSWQIVGTTTMLVCWEREGGLLWQDS